MTSYSLRVLALAVIVLLTGCVERKRTGVGEAPVRRVASPADTLYTKEQAMAVYSYRPEWALQIIDSAVIVGNLTEEEADLNRTRIYCRTQMGERLDSMLSVTLEGEGIRAGVRFDMARTLGERLLTLDTVQAEKEMVQDVLELLIYTARMQQDTLRWLERAQELVAVCREQGQETEALRAEAEVGAALVLKGEQERGLARLDSVIDNLGCAQPFRFNELDAFIIASKRKIGVLNAMGLYAEVLPLAHRIVERLDDYAQHPEAYHDSTIHEPVDATDRADYIRFYTSQAQNFITVAYAVLGELGGPEKIFCEVERVVRDASAREHAARYHALEQQMQRAKAELRSRQMAHIAQTAIIVLIIIIFFAAYIYSQNRRIRQKNRALVRMIEAASEGGSAAASTADDGGAELFAAIDQYIRSEHLYAKPNLQRQDVYAHFDIRREHLSQVLAEHSGSKSFPAYINAIRLSEVCRLLREHPDMTINAIAAEVGLQPRNLRRLFVEQYGMTPSEFRQERTAHL